MTSRGSLWRFASALVTGCALLFTGAAAAEDAQQQQPSVAEMEAALDQAWAMALSMDDSTEPIFRLEAFSTIAMQEFMLDRVRAMARGVADEDLPNADASRDRMIARWRREKPGDPGPDLFLTFSIEDMAERLAATQALLARYPDDVLLVSVANNLLGNLDQREKAGELLEGFLQRHPESSQAWRMLVGHYNRGQNETRKTELIARWAQREPVDPAAVSAWLGSSLGEQEPAATAALLDRFFAGEPQGGAAMQACSEVARRRPDYRQAARACVARTAAGGDGTPAARAAAAQAGSELAGMAVRDGDWDGLLAALGRLPAVQRRQALLSAVHQVAAPAGCDTRVALLRLAAESGGGDEEERGQVASSIAGALQLCASHRAARAMYLDLLRTAPNPSDLVMSWTARNGDRWLGDLPAAEAAPLLERRLAENPSAELAASLFRALDVTYQVAEEWAAHRALLVRWHKQQPELDPDQAVALAGYLLVEGKQAEAIAVLRDSAQRRADRRVLEMLWGLHIGAKHPEQAQRLVAELLAGDEWRAAIGHLLAGRGALLAGDLTAAEPGYTAYLERFAEAKVAGELVFFTGELKGAAAASALAARLCAAAQFAEARGEPAACVAALVAAAGNPALATKLLAQQAAQRPDDLETLRDLAWKAQESEQWALVEQTRRKIVALDPRASDEWVHLGIALEKQGKTAELERLLAEARSAFQQPPVDLLRAAGRAWTAAGDAGRAVPLLEEARAGMPAGSELGWIDAEVRQAYAAAGRGHWVNPYAKAADAERLEALRRAADAGDLAASFDYAAESLREGRSLEQCKLGMAALERAATAGHRKSAAHLGRVLYWGSACRPAAPAAALGWLRRGVDASTRKPEAVFDLGMLLFLGEAGEPAPAEGMALIERAAAFPYLLAVEASGLVYASGAGMPRDVDKARRYFAQANRLGSDTLDLLARNANWRQFAELVRRAVERLQALASEGDPFASGLLARLHQLGRLVPQDADAAVRLARPAAARGDATAMRVLYWAHRMGEGAARDDAETLRWLRSAAEAGDSYCMMFLSQRLLQGDTVPRDVDLGLTWLEKAVAAGNRWALHDLAHIHAEGGHGLPRDAAKAAPWMQQLAKLGDFEARGWLAAHGYEVKELKEIDE